ncbi:MAG: hypothetical protein CMP12_06140 [Zunongwangia sp.]|jgi:hypothetical protein|uniref:hypothetical protein n=1 Tax=Zunongwangia profunda TaxID=398743 RepID=UPI000C8DD63F|nr:hypothetical protein [Zunongwangia profunda]MAG87706.1 hypothetical protein [Flavobacteriaceae bacterium]MAO35482.1 hypothetical protein [Zunongwangia sp.]|tara:strand:- start:1601 stop:1870 length:270 start_codon:yes stop_codon:yes gene_type:complete
MEELNNLFKNNEDFKKHVDNLWKTREGLHFIYESRPDLRTSILTQLKTLNEIIGALIKERPYHPKLGFRSAETNGVKTAKPLLKFSNIE